MRLLESPRCGQAPKKALHAHTVAAGEAHCTKQNCTPTTEDALLVLAREHADPCTQLTRTGALRWTSLLGALRPYPQVMLQHLPLLCFACLQSLSCSISLPFAMHPCKACVEAPPLALLCMLAKPVLMHIPALGSACQHVAWPAPLALPQLLLSMMGAICSLQHERRPRTCTSNPA